MADSVLQCWDFFEMKLKYILLSSLFEALRAGAFVLRIYFQPHPARHVISGASASPWQVQSGRAHQNVLHQLLIHGKPGQMFLTPKHRFQTVLQPKNRHWDVTKWHEL